MKKISVGKFSDIVWIFMENVSIRGSFSIKNTLLVGFGPAFPSSLLAEALFLVFADGRKEKRTAPGKKPLLAGKEPP